MAFLYVLFVLSVFCPVYTYAIYPVVLKTLKEEKFNFANIEPFVSVVITGTDIEEKAKNVSCCNYPNFEVIKADNIIDGVNKAKGEVVLFTDSKTKLDIYAIAQIVKPFTDERVACVVGQQTNPEGNSAFWKYENLVKSLESRIGCVSGANEAIFAVKKTDLPILNYSIKNKLFYIATKITENGKNVLFQPLAKAYERKTEGTNFDKHVKDAAGYWQALTLFPKMLLPGKSSFVYISHRVMKWFVWLNMVMMLVTSSVLSLSGLIMMFILFWLQVVGYLVLLVLGRKERSGPVGKLLSIGYYFVMLNVAYFVGMFHKGKKI